MKRLAFFILLAALSGIAHSQTSAVPYLLTQTAQAVQTDLNSLNADLTQLAKEWGSRAGSDLARLSDKEVRAGLKGVVKRNPIVIDASLVTNQGILAKVEPAKYRSSEGKSIADQPQFVQLRATGKPVLGAQIRMVEGMQAMDLEVPILGANGQLLGSVSAIFDARKLMEPYQETLLQDMPFRLTLLQTDGRIFFSSFGDPVFENLKTGSAKASESTRRVVQRILTEPRGEGIFDMNSADTTDDHAAYWVSVGLHGRELRLVLLSDAGRNVPAAQVNRAAALAQLQKLAAQSAIREAVAGGNSDALDDAFIRLIQQNPDVYSVQAIDSRNAVFAGQPIGGAPVGYRLSEKRASDREALAAIKSGKASQYEAVLLEGGRALFTVVPVPSAKGTALMSIIRFR